MSDFFKKITGQKPFVYGFIYLGIIPIFAIIYSMLPCGFFDLGEHESNATTFIYFSVITITTLGYGDITPLGAWSEMLTALESILGITLIGLFLNSLSHQHSLEVQKNEKKRQKDREYIKAIERFSAFNKLIEINIGLYTTYTIPITVPIKKRNNEIVEPPKDFEFKDMKDLFQPTLRLSDSFSTPAIELYFNSLSKLTLSLEEMVKLGYLQHWKEIEDLCLEFINLSRSINFSDYILNQPKMWSGTGEDREKSSDFDVRMIEGHEGEVKFLPSNSKNPYVGLFILINSSLDFIEKYKKHTNKIKSS